jgi:serine/threonine-protein kinase
MDDERTLRPGDRLDRYELLAPIASGGMASVWLAQLRGKRGFEKLFAIKTIKTDLEGDPRFQEMFLDEARIASGIQHPNVAQILDLGEQGDLLYIVMEWVDGDSLAHVRRSAQKQNKALPLAVVLRVMADACAGLHAAHELCDVHGTNLGVVHRDVSPHNIIVSSSGAVKVIDFGVAKAKNRRAGETSTGVIKGKIRFMAPEQVQGHAVDRRADLWALGVCLYQLVTGELPFDDDGDIDVLRRLMGNEPPPRPTGAVPEAIEEILAHSLVRDPEERFATGAAMERAIEAAIDEIGLRATNDDVAAFLRATVPELEAKRRETVTKALEAARDRELGPGSKVVVSAPRASGEQAKGDEATIIQASSTGSGSAKEPVVAPKSEHTKTSVAPKAKASSPGKRKKARTAARSGDESKETLVGASIAEPRAAPKQPQRPLLAAVGVVAVVAGAWFVWPGGARISGWLSPAKVPEPRTTAVAAPAPPPPPAKTVAPAKTTASAPATAAPTLPASSASAAASLSSRPAASAAPSASNARDAGAPRRFKRPRPSAASTAVPTQPEVDPNDDGAYE